MAIVVGLDVRRAQITYDALNTATGEVATGGIAPADRATVRTFLRRRARTSRPRSRRPPAGGWWSRELQRAGAAVQLAEPTDTTAARGPKRRAKTDRRDARHLRDLLLERRLPRAALTTRGRQALGPSTPEEASVSHFILLATSSASLHRTLCDELRADGHSVQRASTRQHAATLLAGQPFDVLLLAPLDQPTDTLELLRELRASRLPGHARADFSVITLGASRELDALRAYGAGSDHHMPADASYLLLVAAIDAVLRRSAGAPPRRTAQDRSGHAPGWRPRRARRAHVDGVPAAVRAGGAADARLRQGRAAARSLGFKAAGRTAPSTRTPSRLQHKLVAHGHVAVDSIWGVGYCLVQGPGVRDDAT